MDTDTLRTDILESIDQRVDALTDLGLDNDGSEPCDAKLDAAIDGDGNTLVAFPSGEYLFTEQHVYEAVDGLAIVATDDPGDVRFTVPAGSVQRIFNIRGASDNVLIEGITFDQREDWETSIGNVIQTDDGGRALLKDVEYGGWNPNEHQGATSSLNCWPLGPESVIVLDGVVQKGRTTLVDYPDNPLCVFSGGASHGTLYVRNSHFENCGEHAIYASRTAGPVRIEGCYFKNNQNTHARIGGEGSYVVNSTFIWDSDRHPNRGDFQAMTGMVFEAGWRGKAGGLVQSCEFICRSVPKMSGCLKVDGSHGGLTVRDCFFDVDADGAEPFWADAPGDSHMIDGEPDQPWDIRMESCTFHGTGDMDDFDYRKGRPHEAAVTVHGRTGTLFRDIEVTMPNRAGFRLSDGAYMMENVRIDVGDDKEPVITDNAEVNRDMVQDPSYEHELRVVAPADAVVEYLFAVSGDARLVTSGEYAATPAGDDGVGETIEEDEQDGATIITGICAREGGDTFEYNGELLRVEVLAGPDPLIYVDGQRITLDDYRDTGPTLEDLIDLANQLGYYEVPLTDDVRAFVRDG